MHGSIIIPTKGRPKSLQRCTDSIARNIRRYGRGGFDRIIIVDESETVEQRCENHRIAGILKHTGLDVRIFDSERAREVCRLIGAEDVFVNNPLGIYSPGRPKNIGMLTSLGCSRDITENGLTLIQDDDGLVKRPKKDNGIVVLEDLDYGFYAKVCSEFSSPEFDQIAAASTTTTYHGDTNLLDPIEGHIILLKKILRAGTKDERVYDYHINALPEDISAEDLLRFASENIEKLLYFLDDFSIIFEDNRLLIMHDEPFASCCIVYRNSSLTTAPMYAPLRGDDWIHGEVMRESGLRLAKLPYGLAHDRRIAERPHGFARMLASEAITNEVLKMVLGKNRDLSFVFARMQTEATLRNEVERYLGELYTINGSLSSGWRSDKKYEEQTARIREIIQRVIEELHNSCNELERIRMDAKARVAEYNTLKNKWRRIIESALGNSDKIVKLGEV